MFTVKPWTATPAANQVHFHYECAEFGAFTETITFPDNADLSAHHDNPALIRILNILSAYMGVSYYKLKACGAITFEAAFNAKERVSIKKIYEDGLGEFYVRNALNYPPKIQYNFADRAPNTTTTNITDTTKNKAILAFGGGKDSHVSAMLLDKLEIAYEMVSVVLAHKVQETLKRLSHKPITFINRKIDPKLIEINKAGKALNGHIPITAINSMILSAYGVMTQSPYVVFSNERGASIPTMQINGVSVNHQYSKSLEFEGYMHDIIDDICGCSMAYFSLLRPFSELWIAKKLALHADDAHPVFSSCNRNFVFEGKNKLAPNQRWCGKCSKCVYTAIILAPNLSISAIQGIFGANILDDAQNIEIAKDLCGIGQSKPWECVGHFDDTAACVMALCDNDQWKNCAIPKALHQALEDKYGADNLRQRLNNELNIIGAHHIPDTIDIKAL